MVNTCSVVGCKERYSKNGAVTFHSYPKDEERRNAWINALGRKNFNPSSFSKVCSKHFTEDCFDGTKFGGQWLKKDAVPTIFSRRSHLQSQKEDRRRRAANNRKKHSVEDGPSCVGLMLTCKTVLDREPSTSITAYDVKSPTRKDICDVENSTVKTSSDVDLSACQTNCGVEPSFHKAGVDVASLTDCTNDTNQSTKVTSCIVESHNCKNADDLENSTCVTNHDVEQSNWTSTHDLEQSSLDETCGVELASAEAICDTESPTRMTCRVMEASSSEANDDVEPCTDDVERKSGRVKKKRKAYVGDLTESDFSSPQAIKKNLAIIKKHVDEQSKKIKILGQTKRRLEQRVLKLSVLVSRLRDKPVVKESPLEKLDKLLDLPESAAQLVKRSVFKEKSREKYPPELRSFALNLHFYSSKAYAYVRKTFNASLPHPKTLRKWYRVVDGAPGFSEEALSSLKLKVAAQVAKKQNEVFALFIEEVEVRQPIDCGDGEKLCGDVDMDTDSEDEELPASNLALTFTLDCVNSDWKIPMAYFLLDDLSVSDRASLVTESLELLHEAGVEPISITFSGTGDNIATANTIGVNLDLNSLHTYLKHPVTSKGVLVIFDGNHTLSL